MTLTKSCSCVTAGMTVDISVLDGTGCGFDYYPEHNTFAVTPGPFSVKAIFTMGVPSFSYYRLQAGHCVKITLLVDGHFVRADVPPFHGQQQVQVIKSKLVDDCKTGRCEEHALKRNPRKSSQVEGGGGAAAAGEAGTIQLKFSQVIISNRRQLGSDNTKFGGPVTMKPSGRSRGDEKFFLEQGLNIKTGDVKGTFHGHVVTSSPVPGGFRGTVKVKYDMSGYLKLRGVVPRDDSPPPNPVPKRPRSQQTDASQRAAAITVKHEPGVFDLTDSSSIAGPPRSRARIIGPIDLNDD